MDNCIFCRICSGDIPSTKVYEDERHLAFLDINPNSKGHTLIVPRKHSENLIDLGDDEARMLISTAKKVAGAIIKATGASGFNLIMNNGKDAGQEVPHVHIHIIPRHKDDMLRISYDEKTSYEDGEAGSVAKKIMGEL